MGPHTPKQNEFCAILDFGSQYSQLIARRVRENRVYCEIISHKTSAESLRSQRLKGIILSGGPCGVYDRLIPYLAQGLRHSFQDIGVQDVASLHNSVHADEVRFELRTASAQREGGIHNMYSYEEPAMGKRDRES